MKSSKPKKLNFSDIKQRLTTFLLNFEDPELSPQTEDCYARLGKLKYRIMLQKVANQKLKTVEIYFEDIEETLRKEEDKPILDQIRTNVKHFIEIFYQIVEKNKPPRNLQINPEDIMRYDLQNALQKQRKQNQHSLQGTVPDQNERLPPSMHRKYSLILTYKHRKPAMVRAISQLTSDLIGSLLILTGIVVRTDQVKPRIAVATFVCDICGSQNYLQVTNNSFHPMTECNSRKCRDNKINGKLTFMPQHSQFIPSQQIKIQQTSNQIKQGNIPRALKLLLAQNNIRQAQPGDIIEIQGVLLPRRKEGYNHEQDLVFEVCIEAFKVSSQKKKYTDMDITEEDREDIRRVRASNTEEELFTRLAKSIAPEIYGLDYVKKALLLQLAGGVTTVTHDRLKIRGEINVMLVGDPGVAKSQLLKQISYLAPRGIYTTGKGSSDVGLTAAIKIDHTTHDVSLEAGALVLADMGVCCIDEFDKMGQYDQTAIHEVMEQQTVSIAKAGLTTTLNARTSVLAAANPLYSRYNPQQTAQKNINLPAALFSRFDLIFIMLDTSDPQKDLRLANHIGFVHKNGLSQKASSEFSTKFLRTYIALCKQFQPKISEDLTSMLIQRYIQRRKLYADKVRQGDRYITTRNLLALIRLCQARARLRFSHEISHDDILQCENIMEESMKNVAIEEAAKKDLIDDASAIFKMIKDLCLYREIREVGVDMLQKRVLAKGFTLDALQNTIVHYEMMDVLLWDKVKNTVQLVGQD